MKIALIKKIYKTKHHLEISFIYNKNDLSHKKRGEVPNIAARWHSICKYSVTPEIKQPEERIETTTVYKNYPFTP